MPKMVTGAEAYCESSVTLPGNYPVLCELESLWTHIYAPNSLLTW